ncbi:Ricin B lectin [Nosema bombycis CQ1]|uniref:Ricin B lectin n=1 Tax=Nosema bombycis (strain CQ1 / CVCC 102059) TaxID=578461 RepID=R0MBF3_NOSB1|nr:Ricin B lectin [Nosema bombycis CQ1]WGJ64369.1 ricin B lectin-like protein [Nosema bombycis]|eukprot:EOB15289.1 Ricin B lectin [Nosema bombycis CQ1]
MFITILLTLKFSQCILIKHKATDKYLTAVNESGINNIKLTTNMHEAVDVILTPFKNDLVFITNKKDKSQVFIISDDNVRLILSNYKGDHNQQFNVSKESNNNYFIKNNGKCLEYDKNSLSVHLSPCNFSINQAFELIESGKKITNLANKTNNVVSETNFKSSLHSNNMLSENPLKSKENGFNVYHHFNKNHHYSDPKKFSDDFKK